MIEKVQNFKAQIIHTMDISIQNTQRSFRNVKATTEPRYFVCLVCSKYYPIGINEQNAIVKEVKVTVHLKVKLF